MQNLKYRFILLMMSSALLSLTFACQYRATNDPVDRDAAKSVVTMFYWLSQRGEASELNKLFGKKFFDTGGPVNVIDMIKVNDEKLGKVKSEKLVDWKTEVLKGSENHSAYVLVYEVDREKSKSVETFSLERDSVNKVVIIGYQINSDGLR